jgi:hypothetical protein
MLTQKLYTSQVGGSDVAAVSGSVAKIISERAGVITHRADESGRGGDNTRKAILQNTRARHAPRILCNGREARVWYSAIRFDFQCDTTLPR